MKLLPHLDSKIVHCDAQLDKPFHFTPKNMGIAYKVDPQNKQLERLRVYLSPFDHVILWPFQESIYNDVTKLFKEEINRFIQGEQITPLMEIQGIQTYIEKLITDPNFKPSRDLETYFSDLLEAFMKETAIQFINEHMAYNMPQITKADKHYYQFEETIYYHPAMRTLTVLQPDDTWFPIGKVSLAFTTEEPTN